MKIKQILQIISLLISTYSVKAQTESLKIGWYILPKGAKVSVVRASEGDYLNMQSFRQKELLTKDNIQIAKGLVVFLESEVVLVFDQFGKKYIAFDPLGRSLQIEGDIIPAKTTSNSGIALLNSDIELVSGKTLRKGMFAWVVSQNIGNETVNIQLYDNQEITIPVSKVEFVRTSYKSNTSDFMPVKE